MIIPSRYNKENDVVVIVNSCEFQNSSSMIKLASGAKPPPGVVGPRSDCRGLKLWRRGRRPSDLPKTEASLETGTAS